MGWTRPLTNPTCQFPRADFNLAIGHEEHSAVESTCRMGEIATDDATLPPRPKRSNVRPPTGGVIPRKDRSVLSVASGRRLPTLSLPLPDDTNIPDPASGLRFGFDAGPDG